MSDSLLFMTKEIPSFGKIYTGIIDGFGRLSLPVQYIVIGLSAGKGIGLVDKFLLVEDKQNGYFCRITFHYLEPELRTESDMDFPVMTGVSSRGEKSLKFAVMITRILAEILDTECVYDDGHRIQDKDAYTVGELKILADIYRCELYPAVI